MATHTFTVTGMYCASCGLLVDDTLEELPGVRSAQTSVRSGRAVVETDDTITVQEVAATITATGYPASWEATR